MCVLWAGAMECCGGVLHSIGGHEYYGAWARSRGHKWAPQSTGEPSGATEGAGAGWVLWSMRWHNSECKQAGGCYKILRSEGLCTL